uniref:OSJNBa0083D01.16 protein n=1 Tax=Oryza sativa subsp. japonica TaxID=39947 RepID=Q7XVE6_ORYSJ|nr:OSJNBa0083D01.16 [Oryza sativa Japonica Group]
MACDHGEANQAGSGNQGPPYGYSASDNVGISGGLDELAMIQGGGANLSSSGNTTPSQKESNHSNEYGHACVQVTSDV